MAELERTLSARGVAPLWRLLRLIASAMVFVLMTLTLVDVLGRYFLNAPLYGAYELTEVGMGVLVFAALPLVTAREQHVTVDLFDQLFSARRQRLRQIGVHLASAIVMSFIAWRVWLEGGKAAENNLTTAALFLPMAPLIFYMAAMAAITGVVMVALAWQYWRHHDHTEGRR